MDGTIVNFVEQFDRLWLQRYPLYQPDHSEYNLVTGVRKYFTDCSTTDTWNKISDIMSLQGSFQSMKPISGAIEAYHLLLALGFDIFICTKPWPGNEIGCTIQKIQWCAQDLGKSSDFIFTDKKELIQADILIDDNPHFIHARDKSWKLILYTQPYNAHIQSIPRIDSWGEKNIWLSTLINTLFV